jgi:hypothetical protein
MIKPYSRDSAFFQSLRDRNMTIAHNDLDGSFNGMVNYINAKLLPVVDILADKQAVGIEDHDDSFLRNIGDGTTIFDIIRSSDLTNYTLTLDRFKQVLPYSVLANDNTENLKPVVTAVGNQVLVSDITNLPKWQKLIFNNFTDKSISSDKVGLAALSARHLTAGIIDNPLADQAIETQYIQDLTIPINKILDNSFTSEKISVELMNTRLAGQYLKFKEKCFITRTIKDNSVDIMKAFLFTGTLYPKYRGILTPDCIPLNSVKFNTTQFKFNVREQMNAGVVPSLIKDGSLDLPAIMSRGNLSVSNSPVIGQSKPIDKSKLSPEFKSILVNKGGLTP